MFAEPEPIERDMAVKFRAGFREIRDGALAQAKRFRDMRLTVLAASSDPVAQAQRFDMVLELHATIAERYDKLFKSTAAGDDLAELRQKMDELNAPFNEAKRLETEIETEFYRDNP